MRAVRFCVLRPLALAIFFVGVANSAPAQTKWAPIADIEISLPPGYDVDEDRVLYLDNGAGSVRTRLTGPTALDALRVLGYAPEDLTRAWALTDINGQFPTPLACSAPDQPESGDVHPMCRPALSIRLLLHPYGNVSALASLSQRFAPDRLLTAERIRSGDLETVLQSGCREDGYEVFGGPEQIDGPTITCMTSVRNVLDGNLPGMQKIWLLDEFGMVVQVTDAIPIFTAILAHLEVAGPDAALTDEVLTRLLVSVQSDEANFAATRAALSIIQLVALE